MSKSFLEMVITYLIINIFLVLFILFMLSILGIEFNTYPHKIIELQGEQSVEFKNLLIQSAWNNRESTCNAEPLLKVGYLGETNPMMFNLNNEEIIFRGNYQIIIRSVWKCTETINLEVVYLSRAFLVMDGKGYFFE